jgi:hypothetical protein
MQSSMCVMKLSVSSDFPQVKQDVFACIFMDTDLVKKKI